MVGNASGEKASARVGAQCDQAGRLRRIAARPGRGKAETGLPLPTARGGERTTKLSFVVVS